MLILSVIREMQIRTTVRFHFIPTGMAIITTTTPEMTSVAEYVENLEHSCIAGRNVKWCTTVDNRLPITVWSTNSTPRYIHKGTDNRCFKNLWRNSTRKHCSQPPGSGNNANVHQLLEARHKRSHTVWFHLYKISRITKCMETESKLVVSRGQRERVMGSDCLMGRGFPLGVMTIS